MNESLAGRYAELLALTEHLEAERARVFNEQVLWREIEARTPQGRDAWWVAFRAVGKCQTRLADLDLRLARLARLRRLVIRGIIADLLAAVKGGTQSDAPSDA